MYGKQKTYYEVAFHFDVFKDFLAKFEHIIKNEGKVVKYQCSFSTVDGSITSVDNPNEEFIEKCFDANYFILFGYASQDLRFHIRYQRSDLDVELRLFDNLAEAEELLARLDIRYDKSRIPLKDILKDVNVFIGHGRSLLWRDLKDHLHDLHGINVTAYETGARAGFNIQEIIGELVKTASIALLVHTGEDTDRDGLIHARENVIHETGLFQGKLGFKRAIVILEEGTNEFSNIAGLQQIRFKNGNIKEVFGDVLAILRREFQNQRS